MNEFGSFRWCYCCFRCGETFIGIVSLNIENKPKMVFSMWFNGNRPIGEKCCKCGGSIIQYSVVWGDKILCA